MKVLKLLTGSALVLLSAATLAADSKYPGFLCCNMRTDGSWISDINYDENGKHIIPVGTPLTYLGQGRNRVKINIQGKDQAIGNDYSRDLSLDEFAKRYVVTDDPKAKISTFPKNIQDAIAAARLTKGMTREQVLMSVGYPVSSENHDLKDKTWRFWLTSFGEFHVKFDDSDHVVEVTGDEDTKDKILAH
jgi:hypothetical protein